MRGAPLGDEARRCRRLYGLCTLPGLGLLVANGAHVLQSRALHTAPHPQLATVLATHAVSQPCFSPLFCQDMASVRTSYDARKAMK